MSSVEPRKPRPRHSHHPLAVTPFRSPSPEGVRAIIHGFFLVDMPDGEALALQLPVLDALYRYCEEAVSRT
jgi:hypothetical protein